MTRYLNTDLMVVSRKDLTYLATQLETGGLFTLFCKQEEDGKWRAGFETNKPNETADRAINRLAKAIEGVDEGAKKLWLSCLVREFDVGFQCGHEPFEYNDSIGSKTINRISNLRAGIKITLYGSSSVAETPSVSDSDK